MKIQKSIPNTLTICNLFCGCLSIVSAFKANTEAAGFFIIAASFFDFFDGFAARLLNCKSDLGKQLDSLADMISFGLAPAVIMFTLLSASYNLPLINFRNINPLPYLAFVIAVFSALRLAKFNIDNRQTDSFIGLPTPANALFVASLPLILWYYNSLNSDTSILIKNIINNFFFLSFLSIILSWLLIAELPLMSLKFKTFSWKDNKIRYIFLLISIISILFLFYAAMPLIIIFYIILSVISNIIKPTKIDI